MAPPTQAHRQIAFESPLGADKLLVRSISVNEQLSRLFEMELDLVSADGSINFDDLIGHDATVRFEMGPGQIRYFSGVVSRFVQTKQEQKWAQYQATLVPGNAGPMALVPYSHFGLSNLPGQIHPRHH